MAIKNTPQSRAPLVDKIMSDLYDMQSLERHKAKAADLREMCDMTVKLTIRDINRQASAKPQGG